MASILSIKRRLLALSKGDHTFDQSLLMPSLFHWSMLPYCSACSSRPLMDLCWEIGYRSTESLEIGKQITPK